MLTDNKIESSVVNHIFDNIINKELANRNIIEYLSKGNNLQGIFQLSSNVTAKYLRKLMPLLLDKLNSGLEVKINEIVELVSIITTIIRPSSQSSGASTRLINKALNISNDTAFSIKNPFYRTYARHTQETYEELIYQEQLMTLLNEVFQLDDLGKSDIYRRYFESNNEEKMNLLKEEYKQLYKGKFHVKFLKEFWEFLVSVAGYSFNKSHAISYTILSLVTVFLRSSPEYCLKYLSACINNAKADAKQTRLEKIAVYVNYINKLNKKCLLPKCNYSFQKTTPVKLNDIEVVFLSIDTLDGIGKVVSEILSKRNDFKDLDEFLLWSSEQYSYNVTDSGKETKTVIFSRNVYETLIEIDYFSTISSLDRKSLKEYIENFTKVSQEYRPIKVLKSGVKKYTPKNNAKLREEVVRYLDDTVLVNIHEPLLTDFKAKLTVENLSEAQVQMKYLKFTLFNICDRYFKHISEDSDNNEAIFLVENQSFGGNDNYKYTRLTGKWDSRNELPQSIYISNFSTTIRKKSILKIIYTMYINKFGENAVKVLSHELLDIVDY